ncbi:MAG: dipeptide ABC transporter ATP-binding protein [Desulfobacter sp.]|nr:dipeptide ABC transporter ATP-binding protein [Desulfobacter sp.]
MKDDQLLTIRQLKKYYPVSQKGWFKKKAGHVKAVDGVDLDLIQGETFGLVGESGCGKSTLGRCILRLEPPTAGQILFEGIDLLSLKSQALRTLRQDMQMIFQDPFSSQNPRHTIRRIVGEPLTIHGMGSHKEDRIRALMDTVGMRPEHLDRYPHEFSGGQRQRICIARALALNPKLIIADEPVSALDVSIQAQILNLLVGLQQKFQLTYLFISHDLSVVRHLCDRIAVMYLGNIVEIAPRDGLYSTPAHPYTQALLDAIPTTSLTRREQTPPLTGDMPSPMNPPPGCPFHPRCRYKQDKCAQNKPMLKTIAQGRRVACHFPLFES